MTKNQDEDDAHAHHDDDAEFADSFFESFDRVPSGVSFAAADFPSSSSSSDEPDDVRISFASAVAPPSFRRLDLSEFGITDDDPSSPSPKAPVEDYGVWMAEPSPIEERRRKLLQGMGLTSSRNLAAAASRNRSRRIPNSKLPPNIPLPKSRAMPTSSPPPAAASPNPTASVLSRARSDNNLNAPSTSPLTGALFRVSSAPPSQWRKWTINRIDGLAGADSNAAEPAAAHSVEHADGVLKIKNLDTGKEFVVCAAGGAVSKLNDPQTGAQLTLEEFEKCLGYSPIVKEVMRRAESSADHDISSAIVAAKRAFSAKTPSTKMVSSNGKKKVSWLKNIKFVASTVTGMMSEREKEEKKESSSSERLKVHHHGKSYKELTGLYMCQEIQAHQGSIWTMKFSCDSRYLASAGEDRIVHVWQVVECDSLSSSLRRQDQPPVVEEQPPLANGVSSNGRSSRMGSQAAKKTKKGKDSMVPDYIVMPETIFSLTSNPVCSFDGHLDDVLDLSWSKSQLLLSSSMDKTVRLWDIETKACLKLFAHNDYVTCIQFNPLDENYFISGSLDAKVRIWNIPDRQVVDWNDLHEMVTAACYTPDGQGALVGTHKGSCRVYNTTDAKLSHNGQIELRTKKKKSGAKKITGFQFAPDNPSEVLITSADSQIRVIDGVSLIHKFRGFRNLSSQISASCTLDGKYVVCASEDSHVYIWKRDRTRAGTGKSKLTTRSHEHFYCKDVSVAIPWPNGGSNSELAPDLPSWSRSQDRIPSNLQDMFGSGREPKKSFSENTSSLDECHSPTHLSALAIVPLSSVSASSSIRSAHSSTASVSSAVTSSSSSLSSWGWGGGSNRMTGSTETANAWGLVVVTAGLGGNIRVYQNFGLPLRLNRPPNLF